MSQESKLLMLITSIEVFVNFLPASLLPPRRKCAMSPANSAKLRTAECSFASIVKKSTNTTKADATSGKKPGGFVGTSPRTRDYCC